jgi:uncharacterized damage-inducible protein DinB
MNPELPPGALPEPLAEAWLRGPIEGVDPLIAPVLFTFRQAREDLSRYAARLTPAQLWARPHGFGSVGFHIRHIAGSAERLLSYLEERSLTPEQLAAIESEHESGMDAERLLAGFDLSLRQAEAIIRRIDPATLAAPRFVGRKRLPTTVIGLLTHIAEHTQRHIGQAISAAKWAALES